MTKSHAFDQDLGRIVGTSKGGGLQTLGSAASGVTRNIDPTKIGTSTYKAKNPGVAPVAGSTQSNYKAVSPGIDKSAFAKAIENSMAEKGPDLSGAQNIGANQEALAAQLAQQGKIAFDQQQGLIGSLQEQAAGHGPGQALAQNMLNQATQQNIQQGAGQIASMKGINPALAARMIGQNTAAANQTAAGQGVNMGLASQLAAQQQLGGLFTGERALTTGAQGNVLNQAREQETAGQLGMGGYQNNKLGTLVSGQGAQNAAITQGTLGTNQINAGVAAGNQNAAIAQNELNAKVAMQNASNDIAVQGINSGIAGANAAQSGRVEGGVLNAAGASVGAGGLGTVLATPAPVTKAHGGYIDHGPDPEVAGDSPKNDKVPIMASKGEIVVPRTAAESPEKAKRFIDHLMAKEGKKGKSPKGYGGVVQAQRELADMKKRMAALEKQIGRAS